MASSGEISAMFTAQNEQFAGRNAFANSIGFANPSAGLGGYGRAPIMGGFQPVPGGFPGMGGPAPVWSYGAPSPFGHGYGGGNAFSAGAISGMGGAATLGMAGVSLAAGFGKLGGLGSMMFDPLTSGWGGFAASRAAGMGMAGALGVGAMAAAPAMLIGAGVSHAIGSFVGGAQNQQAIGAALGQHQFINPASRTGMGFTRDDAKAFGDSVRQLAHVPEMLTSVDELTRLLPQLRKAGSFQGVKDITEFQERFKESVKTLKEVSRMLGSTMEEAGEFFAHSRSVGFLGRQSQLQNVMNGMVTSGMTGMSTGQVMGLQQGGAAAFRQQGVSGRFGAMAATKWAQDLGYAQQTGAIGQGALEDITGLQGPEAVAAAAQNFSQKALAMTRDSAVGKLLTYGLTSFDKDGVATGIDADRLAKLKSGELTYHDLKRFASGLTDTQKTSASRYADDIAADVVANAGGYAVSGILTGAMNERYGNTARGRESAKLLMQRTGGFSAREADAIFGMGEMDQDEGNRLARIRARDSMLKEKYSPSAMMHRFGARLSEGLGFHWLGEKGAEMYTNIGKGYDEFWDDALDREEVGVSAVGASALRRSLGGSSKSMRELLGDAYSRDELDRGFSERSSSRMTAGRLTKLLVGGTVGVGVGLFTGGVGGVAAGAGAMALMDKSGLTEAIDRGNAGGISSEELERLRGLGASWAGAAKGYGDSASARDVIRALEKGKFKNSMGEMVSHEQLSTSEREQALRQASTARVGQLISEASGGTNGYAAMDSLINGDAAGQAELDRMAEKSPELKRWVTAAKRAVAAAKSSGSRIGSTEELLQGTASIMTGGRIGHGLGSEEMDKQDVLDTKTITAMKANASEALSGLGIDSGLQGKLAKSRSAQKLLHGITQSDEVREAVSNRDYKKLKALGYDVSQEDLAAADAAWQASRGHDLSKVGDAVKEFNRAEASEQKLAIQGSIKGNYETFAANLSKSSLTGGQLSAAEKLRDALKKAGTSTKHDDIVAGLEGAQGAIGDLVSSSMGMSDKDLESLRELGPVGSKVIDAVKAAKAQKKTGKLSSAKDIAKALHLSESDEMVKSIAGEKTEEAIQSRIAAMKTNFASEGERKGAHDRDSTIVDTLKEMQAVSKLQTSLLATIARVDQKEVDRLTDSYRPDANAGPGGNTQTSPIQVAKRGWWRN